MCVCLFRHPEALMVLYSVYSGTNWTNGAWLLCFSIHLSIQESIFLPLSCFNQSDLELNWLMGTRYHKYNLLNSELSSKPLMCSPRPFFFRWLKPSLHFSSQENFLFDVFFLSYFSPTVFSIFMVYSDYFTPNCILSIQIMTSNRFLDKHYFECISNQNTSTSYFPVARPLQTLPSIFQTTSTPWCQNPDP